MPDQNRTPRRTDEQWQAVVDRQIQSDLFGAAFCQSEGIKFHSFMNWRTKLRPTVDGVTAKPEFIELTGADPSPDERPGDWLVELDLAPGVQLRIAR